MDYEHLRLNREAPLTERHRIRNRRPRFTPDDARAYGATLVTSFHTARQILANDSTGGFDDRKLLKIRLRADEKGVPNFDAIPGINIVSQEDESIVLTFATEEGLDEVESRLATLAHDGAVTYKELFYVIESFDSWRPQDRKGPALRDQGFPGTESFILDAELWPQERQDIRQVLLESFKKWSAIQAIEQLDVINKPSLIMVRLRCTGAQAKQLLRHRDIRMIDLPPRLGVAVELLHTDISQFSPTTLPTNPLGNIPAIAVLDSDLTPGHPLLGKAVGDAQDYLTPLHTAHDISYHGTFVAGLALYGDVEENIQQRQFIPQLRLFSGKVFNDNGNDQSEFVEKAVEKAVEELHTQYGCRVFNFSYGDLTQQPPAESRWVEGTD